MIAPLREWLYRGRLLRSVELPARVWSVGNLSLGGTGKSPMVMLLAAWAAEKGLRPWVLSRGYKRKFQGLELVRPGDALPSVDRLGDEPWMIKRRVAGAGLLVHKHRARMAARHWSQMGNPSLVLLDDGFQHWPVARDREIVMLDAQESLDQPTIPFGRLREAAAALRRADLVVITRASSLSPEQLENLKARVVKEAGDRGGAPWQRARSGRLRVIAADYAFDHFFDREGRACGAPGSGEFLLVAGVAKPDGVHRMIAGLGLNVVEERYFPDHHRLTDKDLAAIREQMESLREGALLLTEKDWARWRELLADLPLLGVRVRLQFLGEGEAELRSFFEEGICST